MSEEALKVYLNNVSEEEAQAVLAKHAATRCRCGKAPSSIVLMRLPGEHDFGKNIEGFCACDEHMEEFMREMAEISYKAGY